MCPIQAMDMLNEDETLFSSTFAFDFTSYKHEVSVTQADRLNAKLKIRITMATPTGNDGYVISPPQEFVICHN